MDVIDQLRGVRHDHFLRMAVEDVQRDAGDQRIAKSRVVSPKVTGMDARVCFVPRAPFVDNKLDHMLLVDLAHDLPVIANQLLHATGARQQPVPFRIAELGRLALSD